MAHGRPVDSRAKEREDSQGGGGGEITALSCHCKLAARRRATQQRADLFIPTACSSLYPRRGSESIETAFTLLAPHLYPHGAVSLVSHASGALINQGRLGHQQPSGVVVKAHKCFLKQRKRRCCRREQRVLAVIEMEALKS